VLEIWCFWSKQVCFSWRILILLWIDLSYVDFVCHSGGFYVVRDCLFWKNSSTSWRRVYHVIFFLSNRVSSSVLGFCLVIIFLDLFPFIFCNFDWTISLQFVPVILCLLLTRRRSNILFQCCYRCVIIVLGFWCSFLAFGFLNGCHVWQALYICNGKLNEIDNIFIPLLVFFLTF